MKQIEKEVSNLYDQLWEELQNIQTIEIVSQFLYNVDLPEDWFKNKICLDAGCGSGFAVWVMNHLGANCYGCDIGDMNKVRERLGGLKVELENASVLDLPYPSDYFDFVHCNGVLHHTTNPRQGFTELVRVTKPGGVLFVGLYGKGGLYNYSLRLGRIMAKFIPYNWINDLTSLVLKNIKVPNSFIPAKVSILDNLYVPIRESYRDKEIRKWFYDIDFEEVVRTKTTVFDHQKLVNRLIHGEGYLQFRGRKRFNHGKINAS
jgi:ubiquinone/menaquinone biosynthesis C-methylase UbiE